MRESMKEALSSTVKDMIAAGLKTSFTQKDLALLGIEIKQISLSPMKIRKIRERARVSQTVFAKLLNVSPSSVRQWEQGKRRPSGSTMVLLELLERSPHLLDYRLENRASGN